ncbi:MAG: hypothetical protein KAS66_00265 [Candidatus Omnitrophica bacterium]|nr:hypothetical protein [Candidatus Omnitrophota bacterium]
MTLPYRRIAPLLSAAHILGSTPATDKESITVPGPSTNAEVWKTRLDPNFRAEFDSIVLNTNFKASSAGSVEEKFTTNAINVTRGSAHAWTSPANAEDDTPSTWSLSSMSTYQETDWLWCDTFGFTIPSTATIKGIEVKVLKRASAATAIKDIGARLIKGGVVVTPGEWTTDYWSTTATVETYGGPTELWGETWTYSDINASNFGVQFAAQDPDNLDKIAYVHTVEIIVYFTANISTKFQINPNGLGWEDIPGTAQTIATTPTPTEFPITVFNPTLTNNDIPADIRLLCTATPDIDFEIFTQHNSASIVGNSVTGSGTNFQFDWTQYIKSAVHLLGTSADPFIKQVDNPSSEIAFMGYVDPGFTGSIDTLEINTNVLASVDSGTQVTTLTWQVRPTTETVWKTAISKVVTLTTIPTAQKFHDDLLSSDFTGWTSGLKGPFEFRMVFSATGTGKTFTLTTNDDYNYCRLNGTID